MRIGSFLRILRSSDVRGLKPQGVKKAPIVRHVPISVLSERRQSLLLIVRENLGVHPLSTIQKSLEPANAQRITEVANAKVYSHRRERSGRSARHFQTIDIVSIGSVLGIFLLTGEKTQILRVGREPMTLRVLPLEREEPLLLMLTNLMTF